MVRFYSSEKGSKMSYPGLIGIALIIIILAVYMQVGNHQFLTLDDNEYVTNNPHVTSGITVENIVWAFTSFDASNWHPVTWLSHMADVEFYGMNPQGHHLTNVVIHTVSSLLLFLLFLRLTGSLWKSSFIAALFALHPLHVESVAWVAERKDVLCAFFCFLTLLLYSEYAMKRKIALYTFSLFFFVLGLMSKPMLVTLPIVMLLMDFWPLNRYLEEEKGDGGIRQRLGRTPALVNEKIPFFVCSLLSGVVTIYAQHSGVAIRSLNDLPVMIRTENALLAYVKYIGKTLWPHDLAVLYPITASTPIWFAISSLLFLILISTAVILVRHQYPYLLLGWFWFLITLVPVIGLIQVGNQSMADRYTYIPIIGLFIMAAWGVTDLTRELKYREIILALLAGAVILASSVLTWQQLDYWQDSFTLYRHTLQVTSDNYLINYNLGVDLAKKGDADAAIHEYQEALRINPNYTSAHINLGAAFAGKGSLDAAIREFRTALLLNPHNTDTHFNLGVALARKGSLDEAIREFQETLQGNPADRDALIHLRMALSRKRIQDQAGK